VKISDCSQFLNSMLVSGAFIDRTCTDTRLITGKRGGSTQSLFF
jgi:hypothetical protein